MDWTQIVVAILGIIGALDLGRFIFFRASRKKADAEADGAVQANDSAAVQTLKDAIAELSTMNREYAKDKRDLDDKVDELLASITRKDETIATLLTMVCKHLGCTLREPVPGQGRVWYEANKGDISLGVDYLPINQLMTRYGERKRQAKEESDAGTH